MSDAAINSEPRPTRSTRKGIDVNTTHSTARRLAILLAALSLPAAIATTGATAASNTFQASFVDIYSQCPTSPPTLVFCGDGTIAGYGPANSTASLTGPPIPIPGSDCQQINAVRTITLTSDAGSLTLTENGTLCPPSAAAGEHTQAGPYTVAKTYTITAATGVFAGATGSGSDTNRSAGNSQVSVLSGTINLP